MIGPFRFSRLDSPIVSDVGLGDGGILTASCGAPHVRVCACTSVVALPGCGESVFQKAHCRLTPTPPAKWVCFFKCQIVVGEGGGPQTRL